MLLSSSALPAGPTLSQPEKPGSDGLLAAGRRLLDRGEYGRAVSVLEQARAHYESLRAKKAKASARERKNRTKRIRTVRAAAVAAGPEGSVGPSPERTDTGEAAVLLALGQAYAAQKERTRAMAQFDSLLKLYPGSVLAGDAQFQKALFELADLPSPADVVRALEEFATFNPLSLDPDVIHHVMSVVRGSRLDRVGDALTELEKTWSGYPSGDRAPEALLRQAALEGFVISQRKAALSHLERLDRLYPSTPEALKGRLFRGFQLLLEDRPREAAAAFEAVGPSSPVAPHARFFAGLVRSYLLDDAARGRARFEELTRSSEEAWRDLGLYHCALLTFAEQPRAAGARAYLARIGPAAAVRVRTWKEALERTLDRIERAKTEPARLLEAALFWRGAGHSRRAAAELETLVARYPTAAEAPDAHLELGRIYSEGPHPGDKATRQLALAARSHPMPELALEARWLAREGAGPGDAAAFARGRPAPGLESLAKDGALWRPRATAELARQAAGDPLASGRLLRELAETPGSPEEQLKSLRDLADFWAEAKRYRPALDLYRRLLAEDPELRPRMLKLAALSAMQELASATESRKTSAEAARLVERASAVARMLRSAGEGEQALELLRRAGGQAGGQGARARLLVFQLEDGPVNLASLGKINVLLKEQALAESDLNELMFWKARVLEQVGVEGEKALDLYRFLVAHGYRADELSVTLAERMIAKGKYREALSLVAKVPPGPPRDLVEARAYLGLKEEDAARDHLVRAHLGSKQARSGQPGAVPGSEERAALQELAALDGKRLQRAEPGKGRPAGETELESLLELLVPEELAPMGEALDHLVTAISASAAAGGRPVGAGVLDRLIGIYESSGHDPGKLAELYKLRIARSRGGPVNEADAIGLARALAKTGRTREAYDTLEGRGPEAALEQARLLREELHDPASGEKVLERIVAARAMPAPVRAKAASELASERRGAKGEAEALAASIAAEPHSSGAADAHARLAELALGSKDLPGAAREHEAAAKVLGATVRGWEMELTAAQEWLGAGRLEDATRAARAVMGHGQEEDIPERAGRVLADAAGREQVEALQKSIDVDDPANPANYGRHLQTAQAQARLLGDFDAADTTLLLITEQFPDRAQAPEILALRSEIARGRVIARHEREGARGLVRAGLLREQEGRDPRGAALDYVQAIDMSDKKGPMALLARLYLSRLVALSLGEPERALRLAGEAAAQPEAGAWSAAIETARLAAKLGPAAGSWEQKAARAMELSDPELLGAALSEAPPSEAASDVASSAAARLDPLRAITPLGPGTRELLERALQLAPAGQPRARLGLELAGWLREAGDPEKAAETCERAEREAPGTLVAQAAAARRGAILEEELADPARAAQAYAEIPPLAEPKDADGKRKKGRRATGSPFQQVAAARLPLVLARKDADEAERESAAAPQSADSFLAAARRQSKDTGQLDRALDNYRAFIRTSGDKKLVAQAYREAAEVLVRADRPKQAVEMLAKLSERNLPGASQAATLLRMAEILEGNLADFEQAARFYKEVQRLAPGSTEAKSAREGLDRIADARKAATRAEKVGAKEGAGGEELHAIQKKFLGEHKDPQAAVDAMKAAIEVSHDPKEQATLYSEMGKLQELDLKDYPGAAESYGNAIDLDGTCDRSAELMLRLGTLESEKLKQPKKAMAIYDEWLKKYYAHPKKIAVMLERARLLEAALDDAQGAIDIYRFIANSAPRSGFDEQALLRIAGLSRTYFADNLGAVDAYDQLARRFPFGPNAQTALFQAGQICEVELGDLNRATQFYNRLIATYPTSPLANDARNALARIQRIQH